MMGAIAEDFVKYVMHLDVIVEPSAGPTVHNVQYSAPEDPVQGSGGMMQAAAMQAAEEGEEFSPDLTDEPEIAQVIKGDHEKLGRNDPCWCGSGKKYKRCHGAAA